MDENFENRPGNDQVNNDNDVEHFDNAQKTIEENTPTNNVINLPRNDYNVNRLSMDEEGNVRPEKGGAAVVGNTSRTFIILGWISAALTLLISPLFAIPGIIFGVLVNRQSRGKGNAIIIVNAVVAALGIIIGVAGTMFRYR